MKRPLAAFAFVLLLAGCSRENERPNVLLISIDTLRADRLGAYGYERDTSPALDRFAAERAVTFEWAVAESSWTLPSHVTMLTGLHPWVHGVRTPDKAPSQDVEMLAERLSRAGYYCFGLTDGGWMSRTWGFDRGFASFEALETDFAQKVQDALAYIRHREGKGPWFGFLHTYDVHCPYDPPEPFFSAFASPASEPIEVEGRCGNPHFNQVELTAGQVAYLSDRYDGGIQWVDAALSELFAYLDEANLWRNTVVIVTSDHGEELGEYGEIGHERTLSPEALRVPLLIAAPGLAPRTIDAQASLDDIVPTVLELTGIVDATERDGRSLLARMKGTGAIRAANEETTYSDLAWQAELAALLTKGTYAVWDRTQETWRVVRNDPQEDLDELPRVYRACLERQLPTLTVANAPSGEAK